MSFDAKEFNPPLKSLLQGRGGLRRINKRLCDLPLVLGGEPDDFSSFDGSASGLARRRHDKIGECAPFDLRSALWERVNVIG